MFFNMMKKCRSFRKFDNSIAVSENDLAKIMECVRFAPTGGNQQNLRFFLNNDKSVNEKIFAQTKWAALYRDWEPAESERPSAYIFICTPKHLEARRAWLKLDVGIAAQTIMLSASNLGLGGCILGSFNENNLLDEFNLGEAYHIELVVAIGKPNEIVVWEDAKSAADLAYYRDDNGVHHVPKLTAEDLIINK